MGRTKRSEMGQTLGSKLELTMVALFLLGLSPLRLWLAQWSGRCDSPSVPMNSHNGITSYIVSRRKGDMETIISGTIEHGMGDSHCFIL